MKYKDIQIDNHIVDGFTLYAYTNDYFIKQRYIGYSFTEAKKDFYNKVNKERGK